MNKNIDSFDYNINEQYNIRVWTQSRLSWNPFDLNFILTYNYY